MCEKGAPPGMSVRGSLKLLDVQLVESGPEIEEADKLLNETEKLAETATELNSPDLLQEYSMPFEDAIWKILLLSIQWKPTSKMRLRLGNCSDPMLPSFLAWNARGLGSKAKRRKVRMILSKLQPLIIFLCETKTTVVSDWLIRYLIKGRDMGWSEVPSVGRSGLC